MYGWRATTRVIQPRRPPPRGDKVNQTTFWLPLTRVVLSVDRLPADDAWTLQTWFAPVAAVGTQILVSDEADAFKTVDNDVRRVFSQLHPFGG